MNMKYASVVSLIAEIRELANNFIISKMKEVGMTGMVTSHGNIMIILFKSGTCKMADIATKINKKKNTVTTLVNKLVEHGYVQIGSDPNDQRVKLVSLTVKGSEIERDFYDISDKLLARIFTGIKEERREELVKDLKKIRENLR